MVTTEQELLEEQILDLIDLQQTTEGMSRGDLQSVVQVLASKYELREEI